MASQVQQVWFVGHIFSLLYLHFDGRTINSNKQTNKQANKLHLASKLTQANKQVNLRWMCVFLLCVHVSWFKSVLNIVVLSSQLNEKTLFVNTDNKENSILYLTILTMYKIASSLKAQLCSQWDPSHVIDGNG